MSTKYTVKPIPTRTAVNARNYTGWATVVRVPWWRRVLRKFKP